MIAKRLDYLMNLTHTKNTELARALAFDASYISRIRCGMRGLPRHKEFIEPASQFFARRLKEEYQQQSIRSAICPERTWPEDREEATALIAAWLSSSTVSAMRSSSHPVPARSLPASTASDSKGAKIRVFYGDEGKRTAVVRFLTDLCALKRPLELLLYSDEKMNWLYEDPSFSRAWASLMRTFIAQGGRIRIIHTVSRDLEEMMEALKKWLPLYMSGAIQPYYYPRLRDRLFQHTRFICPGHAAVFSTSVCEDSDDMANFLVIRRDVVNALELEFRNLLEQCRPLMTIDPLPGPPDRAPFSEYRYHRTDLPGFPPDMEVYADEKSGVAILHTTPPWIRFLISEERLSAAILEKIISLPSQAPQQ